MIELTVSQRNKIKEVIGACEKCGSKECLEVNRIHPGYLGGKYILRNIEVLCKECHKLIHYNEF